jgi:hypothetical protein
LPKKLPAEEYKLSLFSFSNSSTNLNHIPAVNPCKRLRLLVMSLKRLGAKTN